MSQKSQKKSGGNTRSPSFQAYCWVFTLPMTLSAEQLSQHLQGFCKKFYFQGEKGEETGYLHWQGCFSLKKKEYFKTVVNMMPCIGHIEPCKDWFAAMKYAQKDETRIEGPFDHTSVFLDRLSFDKLYPWQKELVELTQTKPDDRKILWICSDGNHGKTAIARYLLITNRSKVAYFNSGKNSDIAFAYNKEPVVIFNFPRSKEGFISYDAMEGLKDGLLFSPKYESNTKVFNSPHVIVLANFYPDTTRLTSDRWDILTIRNTNQNLRDYERAVCDRAPLLPFGQGWSDDE